MNNCKKCEPHGFSFSKAYPPTSLIAGHATSPVWIVGLNPAGDPPDTVDELRSYFTSGTKVHPYFRRFLPVSQELFRSFGREDGAAHMDLVKCHSSAWPPPGGSAEQVIANCEGYLLEQIHEHRPALIVCNGREVCNVMLRLFPPPGGSDPSLLTSYFSSRDRYRLCVILSGFIGRIDNYAKRRLGLEIEMRLSEIAALANGESC